MVSFDRVSSKIVYPARSAGFKFQANPKFWLVGGTLVILFWLARIIALIWHFRTGILKYSMRSVWSVEFLFSVAIHCIFKYNLFQFFFFEFTNILSVLKEDGSCRYSIVCEVLAIYTVGQKSTQQLRSCKGSEKTFKQKQEAIKFLDIY